MREVGVLLLRKWFSDQVGVWEGHFFTCWVSKHKRKVPPNNQSPLRRLTSTRNRSGTVRAVLRALAPELEIRRFGNRRSLISINDGQCNRGAVPTNCDYSRANRSSIRGLA
jgi:hypothetical protein